MQEGPNARQQIVERIRQSTSILVAVSANPSVDALAAALGLSLMLNKLNKHATTVFSGQVPPAIQFLEPNKTFESNVDALRDFIISLDKEKADRLRYKVEDDVVRIFITPYKTSITEKDLQYSQGDFNVDLILALGVEKRDDLDKAIVSHGRILHDATVATINTGNQHSSLGALDWSDSASSSLCEMLVSLSEALQQPGILDAQASTALLTGIVAATDRFSNKSTTPRVMTMAAQLMAAGANQQLIATNLEQAHAIAAKPQAGPVAKQGASTEAAPIQEEKPKKEPGELDITHEEPKQPKEKPLEKLPQPATPPSPSQAEAELEAALPGSGSASASHELLPDLQKDLEDAVRKAEGEEAPVPGSHSVNDGAPTEPKAEKEDYISSHGSWKGKRLEPPTMGGTLNATTEEAREGTQKAQDEERNHTLLDHPGDAQPPVHKKQRREKENPKEPQLPPAPAEPAPAIGGSAPVAPAPGLPAALEPPVVPDALPEALALTTPEAPPVPEPAPTQPAESPSEPDLAALHNEAKAAAQAASETLVPAAPPAGAQAERAAVNQALQEQPFEPANQPLESVGAQPLPAMPDVPVAEPLSQEALQALPPAPASNTPPPAQGDLPPLPPMPPMPTTDTALPPLPPSPDAPAAPVDPAILPPAPNLPGLQDPVVPTQTPPTNDPGQFKIPGA